MEFTLDRSNSTYQIQSYDEQSIVVSNQKYYSSLIVMPETLILPWEITSIEKLTSQDFENLLPFNLQIVLLGTGKDLRFPPATIFNFFLENKVGLEVMSTAAACRTYQLLMTEGRKVAAALIL